MIPMECPRCSAKLYQGTRFCPTCGLSVEDLIAQDVPEEAEDDTAPGAEETQAEADDSEETTGALDKTALREKIAEAQAPAEEADAEKPEPEEDPSDDDAPDADGTDSDAEAQTPQDDTDAAATDESSSADGDSPTDTTEPTPEDAPEAETSAEATSASAVQAAIPANAARRENRPEPKAPMFERVRELVKKYPKLAIALAVVVVLVVVFMGAWMARNAEAARIAQEKAAATEKALNTLHTVEVGLSLSAYDEAHDSPIPLRISGTSKTGEQVDEVRLVTPSKAELSLLPGTYTVSLAGNPVSQSGRLFSGSVDSFEVTVNEATVDDEEEKETTKPTFAFAQVAPEDVTDAEIDSVQFWMQTAGISNAQQYVDALRQARQEAQDRLAQEQAAQEEERLRETEQITQELDQQLKEQQKKEQSQSAQNQSTQSQSAHDQSTQSQSAHDQSTQSYGQEWYEYDSWSQDAEQYDYY